MIGKYSGNKQTTNKEQIDKAKATPVSDNEMGASPLLALSDSLC